MVHLRAREKASCRTQSIGQYLRRQGIMLRRTRKEVGRELPALSKIPHEVESDAKALDAITGDAAALARIILRANEQYRGEKMQAAGEFDRLLRQATGVAKAPYVAEFVRLLLESGQKVLLFGWHREVYSIWQEKLAAYNPVMYTGSESPSQKQAAKDAFISGDSQVMLISSARVRASTGCSTYAVPWCSANWTGRQVSTSSASAASTATARLSRSWRTSCCPTAAATRSCRTCSG